MSSTAETVRNKKIPVVAIAGATGAVGVELMQCLEQRKFPLSELRLLASARSAGKRMKFRGGDLAVQELTDQSLEGVDIALFSAGGAQSRRFAPAAVRAGAIVVDNSSAFRMDKEVPLVVPEINAGALALHKGIIANPNCVAIVAVTPLWPIHQKRRIKRIVMSTYQAASGAGAAAMEELSESTRAYLEGRAFQPKVLPHPYAFNVFSHNTRVDPETGYNEEETKVMQECRKIFGEPDLRVTATCVRVPVLRAHCIALNIELEGPLSPAEARSILADAPGVRVVDDLEKNYFPMPVDASGKDEVLVGRIRKDVSDPTGCSLSLFVAGDQLRKGAALNAVQIAERLLG
ncbi:MAG TPA: aspartate-semialdehyde dehydrogenase [Steroidobacteraceae bacterium]|nr:aspartate-semialdehyde dehydrogenase [Steroidobacteraceae bacterium]